METNKKLSFFERINISVFKLENYGIFIGEKFSKSIKYFLLLILMIAIIVSLLDVYDFCKVQIRNYKRKILGNACVIDSINAVFNKLCFFKNKCSFSAGTFPIINSLECVFWSEYF